MHLVGGRWTDYSDNSPAAIRGDNTEENQSEILGFRAAFYM